MDQFDLTALPDQPKAAGPTVAASAPAGQPEGQFDLSALPDQPETSEQARQRLADEQLRPQDQSDKTPLMSPEAEQKISEGVFEPYPEVLAQEKPDFDASASQQEDWRQNYDAEQDYEQNFADLTTGGTFLKLPGESPTCR